MTDLDWINFDSSHEQKMYQVRFRSSAQFTLDEDQLHFPDPDTFEPTPIQGTQGIVSRFGEKRIQNAFMYCWFACVGKKILHVPHPQTLRPVPFAALTPEDYVLGD